MIVPKNQEKCWLFKRIIAVCAAIFIVFILRIGIIAKNENKMCRKINGKSQRE